ncbi:uncharacterized protein LOC144142125 [Haemaphysalis longicornis]
MAASLEPEAPYRLVSEIHTSLPDIPESCRRSLVQAFAQLGVRSPEDAMTMADPEVLVQILGAEQAKKLVAHFNRHSTSTSLVVTEGAWAIDHGISRVSDQFRGTILEWGMVLLQVFVDAVPQISAACSEVSASCYREQEKRKEIMKDTLCNLDESLTEAHRIHADIVNELKRSLCGAKEAHEKMLEDLREEEARFSKAMEKKRERRILIEELERRELREEQGRRKPKGEYGRWRKLEEQEPKSRRQQQDEHETRRRINRDKKGTSKMGGRLLRWKQLEEEHELIEKLEDEQERSKQQERERWTVLGEEYEIIRKLEVQEMEIEPEAEQRSYISTHFGICITSNDSGKSSCAVM